MTLIESFRQWAGAALAFLVLLVSSGHPNAGSEIALAMPMCFFFVCLAAYYTRKQIVALQAQVDELRAALAGVTQGPTRS
jgi:hypothetical protein